MSEPAAPPTTAQGRSDAETRFADFFAANWDRAYRLAVLMGADDPEDIAQEAFSRVHPRFTKLDTAGDPVAYLNRVICNLAKSRWRRSQTAKRLNRAAQHDVTSTDSYAVSSDLSVALDSLSLRQRQVLVLRFWVGMSEAEIAETLTLTRGSVKSHAHRGLKRLAETVEVQQ